MMRRLSYMLLTMLLVFFSCTKEGESGWDGPVIELKLVAPEQIETRAGADGTQDGINKYNENLISWVDIFFYPGGETDSDATYHVRHVSGKQRSDVLRIELTSEQVNSIIFPSIPDDIRTCTVFAIANYPETLVQDEADLSGTSLTELSAITVQSDFVSPTNHRQTRFMMSGTIDLVLRGRAQSLAAAGTIDLVRYACKLTVGVDVSDEVRIQMGEDRYETWHPMLSGMEIYLVNGVSDVTLAGEKTEDPEYFSYRDNSMRFAYTDMQDQIHYYFEKEGNYYNTYPMYMYPQHWDYGSTESPRKEPFLKLVVPWVRDADPVHGIPQTQKQYYYKVMIPDDRRAEFKRSFVRNNWYHINIRVGILGSETDEATVPILSGWCYIVYWQDKEVVIKNAEIGNARYLAVEQNQYELHNVRSTQVHYTSSHPVKIKDIRVTRPYYGTNTSGDIYGGTIHTATGDNDVVPKGCKYLEFSEAQRKAMHGGTDWFSDSGTYIEVDHELQNDYTLNTFDYSPITMTFTLVHADRPDDDSYMEQVTVIQYPGIYIQQTINTDPLTGPGGKPLHWGYVYVDNEQYTLAQYNTDSNNDADAAWRYDHLWRVVYYNTGGIDMNKINVTVLPEDSEFIIGDPRQDDVDNLRDPDGQYGYFHDAPAIEGGTRSLQYYYPTENSSRTINMISPIYRISTKLSGIEHDGITFQKAKERCAAFQENGFPAGRWRIPTKGEIRFIAKLSTLGFFDWQFGGDYWSANGPVYVNKISGEVRDSDRNMDTGIALLRCVYDSWYWGDEQVSNLEQFTWGDAER